MSDAAAGSETRTPIILDASLSDAVDQAVASLRSGELISFPTDTVYALAAALDRPAALEAIYSAKGRSLSKAIPILLTSSSEVGLVASPLPGQIRRFVESVWPGPVTVVLPARDSLPGAVATKSPSGERTVAVRVPDHPLARDLIKRAGGALSATSANLSGQPPATDAAGAVAQLGWRLHTVLDGGPAPGGVASTIVAITPTGPEIIRQGDLPAPEITRCWEESKLELR